MIKEKSKTKIVMILCLELIVESRILYGPFDIFMIAEITRAFLLAEVLLQNYAKKSISPMQSYSHGLVFSF